MTSKTILVNILRCLAIIAIIPGCHLIFPFKTSEPVGKNYECTTWIMNCKKTAQKPKPTVSLPTPSGTCYSLRTDLKVGDPAYCDRAWKINSIEMPELRGARGILTAQADNQVNRQDFLRFTWASETEALFVAYDSRAAKKPDWLAPPAYRLVTDTAKQPLRIRIARPDNPNPVDLEIFKRVFLSKPKAGQTISIPSNLHGNPGGWTPITPHLSSMYMVIVQPKLDYDCNNLGPKDQLSPIMTTGCYSTEKLAKDYSAYDCEYARSSQALSAQTCAQPVCVEKGGCAGEKVISELIGKRAFASWSFLRSSEIEFDPAISKAEVTVEGSKYSQGVKGTLHFQYLLDDFDRMQTLELNSMYLELGKLSSAIGTFVDIEVGLSQPTRAECLLPSQSWATPCNAYRIAAGELVAKQSAFLDGKPVVFVAQNVNYLDITINHQTRSFKIQGGPLKATIEVNEKDRDVLTKIDLTGKFKNFEPHAVATESTRVVECGGADAKVPSNLQPVHLNSAGSFDIYDSLTGATFDWYEDFGLVTQKSWGQGSQVTIQPYQLSYGVHQMTLVIRDSIGAMSTDTFDVEVRDSVSPTLSIPPDRYFLLMQPSGPVHIALGQATATDICEQHVAISNDAPSGSMFSPGVTPVTWAADDGGGNVTTKVQNVYVFQTPDIGQPVLVVEAYAELIDAVAATAQKSATALESCAPTEICQVGFEELSVHLEQLEVSLGELETTDETAELQTRILERLRAAQVQLMEAGQALDRSALAVEEAAEIRSGALELAADSGDSLLEVGEMLRALAREHPAEEPDR